MILLQKIKQEAEALDKKRLFELKINSNNNLTFEIDSWGLLLKCRGYNGYSEMRLSKSDLIDLRKIIDTLLKEV